MNTPKAFFVFFIFFFVLISSTYAHFQFENPPTRGHGEDTMTQPPCGGYDNVNTTAITPFPVTEGRVTTEFEDGNGVLVINYAPTVNDTFKPVSENVTINVSKPQQIVTPVDLSKAGVKSGDQGVLQAIYTGVEGIWYQCTDIKVVDAKKTSGATFIIGTSVTALFTTILVSFFMMM
ncbi:hypothetical protein RhiirA4_537924 [Rhizophagus irregularis]|uniref:Copper acquisition factor BIM1-like domain-containing protein n=1 Tax=Rhizophagus irregularis TaxID=588596 RepID=A0A2I1FXV9_9GLOM|nr:hypothetical protein RhiirA4_537924 [Rhizophagus irregularis]